MYITGNTFHSLLTIQQKFGQLALAFLETYLSAAFFLVLDPLDAAAAACVRLRRIFLRMHDSDGNNFATSASTDAISC